MSNQYCLGFNESVHNEGNTLKYTRYYIGSYEKKVMSGGTTSEIDYIYLPDGEVAVSEKTGMTRTLRYVHTDYLGSFRTVTDVNGSPQARYSYDAWGMRSLRYGTETGLRGYTGHEHLTELGLINMNARLYDPVLARFLGMDPYVAFPDYTQGFNRYAYAMNNPLVITDPSGEFPWLVAAIFGLAGGIGNVVANLNAIDGFEEGFVAFFVGAGAGIAAVASGGASIGTTLGVAAGTGVVTSATNSVISQTNNFEGGIDWGRFGKDIAVGTVANVAGAGAGHWASNASTLVNNISSPMLRSAVVAPIASAAGHVAGGTTLNLFEGQSFGEAFENSFTGIGRSMVIATTTSLATTYITTYTQGYSPWSGEKLSVKGTPKPSPKFKQPTNPPQVPPASVPKGYNLRIMPPTEQYPNGYWVIEKPMPQGGYQKIDPATMRPGQRHETHVPLPPGYLKNN